MLTTSLITEWENSLREHFTYGLCLIALISLSSCEKNNQIPFKNIPHKEDGHRGDCGGEQHLQSAVRGGEVVSHAGH